MDLEENIRIAAEVYAKPNYTPDTESSDLVVRSFIAGAKSQAAKDYWYNIFKYGDGILEQLKNVPVFDMSKHDIPHIVNGKDPHYPYGIIQSDPLYGATQKDFDNVKPKNIGIIGGVNHGKPMIIVLDDSWDVARQALNKIESIVPIADVIPEQIISKQELLLMHDKAMERSITEETYKESRAWDIKKEKKVSHKRTNKRR